MREWPKFMINQTSHRRKFYDSLTKIYDTWHFSFLLGQKFFRTKVVPTLGCKNWCMRVTNRLKSATTLAYPDGYLIWPIKFYILTLLFLFMIKTLVSMDHREKKWKDFIVYLLPLIIVSAITEERERTVATPLSTNKSICRIIFSQILYILTKFIN
jgi:hypothetical protein